MNKAKHAPYGYLDIDDMHDTYGGYGLAFYLERKTNLEFRSLVTHGDHRTPANIASISRCWDKFIVELLAKGESASIINYRNGNAQARWGIALRFKAILQDMCKHGEWKDNPDREFIYESFLIGMAFLGKDTLIDGGSVVILGLDTLGSVDSIFSDESYPKKDTQE